MKLNQEFDFQDYLLNNTKGYTGKYAEFILLLPDLYSLLCKLLDSKDLPIQLRAGIAEMCYSGGIGYGLY